MTLNANYETITISTKDKILELSLNRPDQLNAMNALCRDELQSVFNAFRDSPELRVIIITGQAEHFQLEPISRMAA